MRDIDIAPNGYATRLMQAFSQRQHLEAHGAWMGAVTRNSMPSALRAVRRAVVGFTGATPDEIDA